MTPLSKNVHIDKFDNIVKNHINFDKKNSKKHP